MMHDARGCVFDGAQGELTGRSIRLELIVFTCRHHHNRNGEPAATCHDPFFPVLLIL